MTQKMKRDPRTHAIIGAAMRVHGEQSAQSADARAVAAQEGD